VVAFGLVLGGRKEGVVNFREARGGLETGLGEQKEGRDCGKEARGCVGDSPWW